MSMPITAPHLSRKSTILKGYAAFNEGDWTTMRELLSADVVWHKMVPPGGKAEGLDDVIEYLTELRLSNQAEFLGMAIQGDAAVTVDFTTSSDDHGDHGCADRIEFDGSGKICEVWHCAADTHHAAGSSAS
jgi:hypothetical protein